MDLGDLDPGARPDVDAAEGIGRIPRWGWWLAGVVVGALVLRVAYVLVVLPSVKPGLDAIWYTLQGGSIRDGTGYVVPTSLFDPPVRATAGFPPLYPAYQALWQAVFGGGPTSVRMAGIVPGAATVALTGVLARRVSGDGAGLIAAAIVALDPVMVAVDGSTMSENLSVPLTVLAVLLAVTMARDGLAGRRGLVRAGALGLVCGLAALTRQDLVALLPLLVVGGALSARSTWPRRVGAAALGLALALVVVVPWAARNHDRVGTFAVSTLSPTSALAGANCDRTYSGRSIGSWEFSCVAAAQAPGLSEPAQASRYQRSATTYLRGHLGRLPLVVAAREARVWGLWSPSDQLPREAEESRRYGWQALAWPARVALVLAGAWGLVRIVRRRHWAWPLVVPVAITALSGAVSHGNPRFSSLAAPVLAVGVAGLLERVGDRRGLVRATPDVVGSTAPV